MHLKYEVEQTKPFPFAPTQLEIYVGAKEVVEGVEMHNVQTNLTEILPNGKIVQEKQFKFPTANLNQLISGYNVNEAIINPVALNQFLSSFFLKLKPTTENGNEPADTTTTPTT